MKINLDKTIIVFIGGLKSIGTLKKGEYAVEPASSIDDELTWYRITGSDKLFGINPKNIPNEITFIDD